jgi:hypothetical protein
MAAKLYEPAFEHAKRLIEEGKYVYDDRDMWSEHQPSSEEEGEFIRLHGIDEYAKWHLGIDEEEYGRRRHKFPYGDFEKVHRCGVLSAESRAGQYKYLDIEKAAHRLHVMMREKEETTKG